MGGAIALLTLLTYWVFPGHLYFFEGAAIYLALMERLWDPTVLKADFLAARPHLSFTIYDEVALTLRRLTGLGFREILTAEQWVFRAVGLLGVYLVARALKLSERTSLLVVGVFALGANIVGSGVSSLEFEAVPKSFALPLILFALGLAANGRYLAAGVAGSVAFLYHPPIGYPFWLVYLVLAAWPSKQYFTRKRLVAFLPLACAGILLFVLSQRQVATSPPEPFFRRLDPLQEQLGPIVAPYVWITTWPLRWVQQHLFLWAVSLLAFWRLRKYVNYELRFFLTGLPLVGVASMPASYLLLEKMKWSFIPQFQPMRALVYLAVVTGILATAAGIRAVERSRSWEGFLWFAVAYGIPTESRVLHILTPRLSSLADAEIRHRVIIVVTLALLVCLVVWSQARAKRWADLILSVSILAPFFLLPYYGRVNQFPLQEPPELRHLSSWARAYTSKDAVFLFPDSGLDTDPTVFRATALRTVYIDWRSSGQVNFFRDFTHEWWSRWQQVMITPFNPRHLDIYLKLGIDYLVVRPAHRIAGEIPVFENSRFVVYRLRRNPE